MRNCWRTTGTMLQKRSISFVLSLVSPKGKWYDNSVDDQRRGAAQKSVSFYFASGFGSFGRTRFKITAKIVASTTGDDANVLLMMDWKFSSPIVIPNPS